MNRNAKLLTILLIFITGVLSACGNSDEPAAETIKTKRTVLVYMMAANNLDAYSSSDINEMKTAVASMPEDTRWLIYYTPNNRNQRARLYELTTEGEVDIQTYEQGTSATVARMRQVIDDMKTAAEARSYGLVIWGHGTGWKQNGIDDPDSPNPSLIKPLSIGNDFGEWMNVTALRTALTGQEFDFIYFDDCLMASVEVAYELRNVADYIVGSAAELPANGMPYDKNLPLLLSGTRNDLIAAARNTFDYYKDNSKAWCTMTVIDTQYLDQLAAATREIYKITPLPHPGDNVTNYCGRDRWGMHIDFGEYVTALVESTPDAAYLGPEFEQALAKTVIYADATDKILYNNGSGESTVYHHSGLSTNVFTVASGITQNGYDQLQWTGDVVAVRSEE